MTFREIHTYQFTCDGFYPNGRVCGVKWTMQAENEDKARDDAINTGWKFDHRGWICNAIDGHRG